MDESLMSGAEAAGEAADGRSRQDQRGRRG